MQNRPFSPRFLKNLDEKWMKKYPLLWSSRIHLVLYYGGLLLIPILLFAFLTYYSPLSENSPWVGNLLLSIISLISIVIWLIYLMRFNPFKRFYIEKPLSFLRTFLLYLFIALFFSSWIFIPQYVGYMGTKMRFSQAQIDRDIEELNNSLIGEAYHKAPEYFVLIKDTLTVSKEDSVEYSYSDPTVITNTITYDDRMDELERKYDSIKKINDTVVEVIKYPPFHFIRSNDYNYQDYTQEARIKKYYDFLQNPKTYEEYHASVQRITSKYLSLGTANPDRYYYYEDEDYYYDDNGIRTNVPNKFQKIQSEFKDKYRIKDVWTNMNVLGNKLGFRSDLQVYLRVMYYLAIGLTMLLFIFRHSTPKSFFLSLLSYFVLFLITLVIMFAFDLEWKIDIHRLLVAYSITCFMIGLTILWDKRKHTAKMIALNLFYMGTIFIPSIIVFLVAKDWFEDHFLSVEIGTFIAMLLMMIFVYRPLYRRWYTLPDE